jgi:uncharacterized repeat protein (TIGR01451 family)
MKRTLFHIGAILFLTFLFGLAAAAGMTPRANGAPAAPGLVCIVDDGGGAGVDYTSIISAVQDANCTTIHVAAGLYAEPGTINVYRDLTLQGAGAGQTIIDGGGDHRVLYVALDSAVAVSGVTLRNGYGSWGAGVQVDGPAVFTLTHSVVASNTSSAGAGGVYVQYLSARATISDCLVSNNRTGAGLNSHGGGIAVSEGRLTLVNSTVLSNSTDYKGGGIYVAGVGNLLTVEGSTVVSNTAGESGGGIFSEVGTMILRHSAVISNVSANNGGGVFSNSNSGFSDTTIAWNRGYKSGGIHNQDRLFLTNVTVSANEAGNTAGAIYNTGNGNLIVKNSTIVYNTYGNGSAGGIYNYAAVSLENTIVAHNEGADCTDMGGTFASQGYNLEYGHTCVLTATGDITDTDPLLGPLQDNGGLSTGPSTAFGTRSGQGTLTHALLVGSPAIDHASFSYPSTDQRGVPRPQGSRCDIGAYERGPAALDIGKRGPSQVSVGEAITYTLTVTNTGCEVAEGLVITDVLPEGASYLGGGALVGDVVSWTLPSLAWWGENTASVQFAVTAMETITNVDYAASAVGGVEAEGETPVVTAIYEAQKIYLPLVLRN